MKHSPIGPSRRPNSTTRPTDQSPGDEDRGVRRARRARWGHLRDVLVGRAPAPAFFGQEAAAAIALAHDAERAYLPDRVTRGGEAATMRIGCYSTGYLYGQK